MNILVQPSERESRAHLMRIECAPDLDVNFEVLGGGLDGPLLVLDLFIIRSGMKPSEAMDALHEARRVARCGAHDALAELASCLAKMRTAS